jgi:Protein of unknown function (DUF4239)
MSLALTGIALIALSVVVALAGLWVFRRVVHIDHFKAEEPVVSFLFNAVGLIYAVILAFVVFAVWEHYSQAEEKVTTEATALVVAYRDTALFPEPQRTAAQHGLRNYIEYVMHKEWSTHGQVLKHTTPDVLNPVWSAYRQGNGSAPVRDRLHNVEEARHLRHLASEASLPGLFWALLIGGGMLVIAFSYFFLMRSQRAQHLMTAMLTMLIAGVLFLIFTLNSPFTGEQPVSKDPFRHALEMFHSMDLGRST